MIVYELNQADHITRTEGDWSEVTDRVVGRPIWDYVRDAGLVEVYQYLFDKVRQDGAGLSCGYRCDTPSHIQRMRLHIRPLEQRAIQVASEVLERIERPSPVVAISVERGFALALRCSICARYGRSQDWADLAEAAASDWLDTDRPIRVYHGICPDCREGILG